MEIFPRTTKVRQFIKSTPGVDAHVLNITHVFNILSAVSDVLATTTVLENYLASSLSVDMLICPKTEANDVSSGRLTDSIFRLLTTKRDVAKRQNRMNVIKRCEFALRGQEKFSKLRATLSLSMLKMWREQ